MKSMRIWDEQSLPQDTTPPDRHNFSGLMRRPDYITYLESKINNPSVHLEITSVCNFACSYCYSSRSTRPKGFMDEALFFRIADQLPEFTKGPIALYVDGEPTLHPKFHSFVKYLNAKGITAHVASNSSTLKPEFLDLKIMITSYISASKEELAQRTKMDFDQYIKRIVDYLTRWRTADTKQSIDLRIYCQSEDFNKTEKLQPKIDFALALLEKAGFDTKAAVCGGTTFFRYESGGGKLMFGIVPIGTGGLFPGENKTTGRVPASYADDFGFCDSAWQRMVIYWDGSIALCCQALQGETRYTEPHEIRHDCLKNLWYGHRNANIFRERMKRGELILPGCKKCLSRYRTKEFYINASSYTPTYELRPGERVKFSTDKDARQMLLSGFAETPLDTAWTNNERAEFGFHSTDATSEAMSLLIDCMVFAPEQLGMNQFVDVNVNGIHTGRIHFTKTQNEIITIALPKLKNGQTGYKIQLLFSERRSPFELGLGKDVRKLGMGIHALTIVAAP